MSGQREHDGKSDAHLHQLRFRRSLVPSQKACVEDGGEVLRPVAKPRGKLGSVLEVFERILVRLCAVAGVNELNMRYVRSRTPSSDWS
jgi:hypothetical protein